MKLEKIITSKVICKKLTEVVRQEKDSLILENATNLRRQIASLNYSYPKLNTNDEVIRINTGEELQDILETIYSNTKDINKTTILCRSNKELIFIINK